MTNAKKFINSLGLTNSQEKDFYIKLSNGDTYSLSELLTKYAEKHVELAWNESRLSFAKEIGDDVSEADNEFPIANSVKEYIESTFHK